MHETLLVSPARERLPKLVHAAEESGTITYISRRGADGPVAAVVPAALADRADAMPPAVLAEAMAELAAAYPLLEHFGWAYLADPALHPQAREFAELAVRTARRRPDWHPETAEALRHLLRARDAAVRAGDAPEPEPAAAEPEPEPETAAAEPEPETAAADPMASHEFLVDGCTADDAEHPNVRAVAAALTAAGAAPADSTTGTGFHLRIFGGPSVRVYHLHNGALGPDAAEDAEDWARPLADYAAALRAAGLIVELGRYLTAHFTPAAPGAVRPRPAAKPPRLSERQGQSLASAGPEGRISEGAPNTLTALLERGYIRHGGTGGVPRGTLQPYEFVITETGRAYLTAHTQDKALKALGLGPDILGTQITARGQQVTITGAFMSRLLNHDRAVLVTDTGAYVYAEHIA